MQEIGKAEFEIFDVILYLTKFVNSGRLCVVAVCDDGEPWGKLTTYVEGLREDEVAVDVHNGVNWDYLGTLLGTGLFVDTHESIRSGYNSYPVLRYTGGTGGTG